MQNKVSTALKAGYSVVANNTNTTLSEMHAYVTMVVFGQLPHKIVFALMPEQNVQTLTRRNVHHVPQKKVREMLKRMNIWLRKSKPSVHNVLRAGEFRRFRAKGTSNDVIYTGIFLDDEGRSRLRSYFMAISREPLLSDLSDCHLTLKFQPLVRDVDKLPFGQKVKLRVVGYARHEYVQCCLVDIMDDCVREMCANECAHITVSYDKERVRPNISNNLLKAGKIVPVINNFDVAHCFDYDGLYRNGDDINGGLVVEGTVGAYYKNPDGGVCFEKRKRKKKRSRSDFVNNEW